MRYSCIFIYWFNNTLEIQIHTKNIQKKLFKSILIIIQKNIPSKCDSKHESIWCYWSKSGKSCAVENDFPLTVCLWSEVTRARVLRCAVVRKACCLSPGQFSCPVSSNLKDPSKWCVRSLRLLVQLAALIKNLNDISFTTWDTAQNADRAEWRS